MHQSKIHSIIVDETVSTNALAKTLLKDKEQPVPFFVQAGFQTGGRGQYTKTWESNAKDNLLLSLVLKPKNISIDNQFAISKTVAVSVLEVLQPDVPNVSIKWPNDIYVGNRKIAGILIENIILGANIEHCVIGIGLNVNQTAFSKDLPNPVSLKQILSQSLSINAIRDKIIEAILTKIKDANASDSVYLKHLYRKGEQTRFKASDGSVFTGTILGVNTIGQLVLSLEGKLTKAYHNSEIEYLL